MWYVDIVYYKNETPYATLDETIVIAVRLEFKRLPIKQVAVKESGR